MAANTRIRSISAPGLPWLALWLAVFAAGVASLALLGVAVSSDTPPSQDVTVLERVSGWDAPGLAAFSDVVSALTNNWPALILGVAGILFFWLIGMNTTALSFALVGLVMGAIAFLGDFTLGELVDRPRPFEPDSGPSFPSGHTFGSTVFFGF